MLRELTYVTTIAKEKSISKAAEKLYITQPALSMFLTRLEAQLGTKLFDRNGMTLTYAGEKYLKMAMDVEKSYHNFELELCNINKKQSGRIKIGTSPHIGSSILPKVLPSFIKTYPNIELSIIEGNSTMLETMLAENSVDLSLLHLPLQNKDIKYEVVGKDRYVLAFQKGHSLEKFMYKKESAKFLCIDIMKLRDEKFILSFPYQRVRQITDRALAIAGIVPDIAFITSSVETALLSAGVGLGVTLLPESYISLFNCETDPNFCYLEDKYLPFWTFVVAHSKSGRLSNPEKLFVQLVRKAFDKSK